MNDYITRSTYSEVKMVKSEENDIGEGNDLYDREKGIGNWKAKLNRIYKIKKVMI